MDARREAVCITQLFYIFTSTPHTFNALNCENRTDLLTSLLSLQCFDGYCDVWVLISALHFFSIETRYTYQHMALVVTKQSKGVSLPLLCFSDKFDQDISDKVFKYTVWILCTFVNFWSRQYVPELRSAALWRRKFPIHKYTPRIGLEENCLETYVLPRKVVCDSRAKVCELITAVLTR
jgi:hypothetical protein